MYKEVFDKTIKYTVIVACLFLVLNLLLLPYSVRADGITAEVTGDNVRVRKEPVSGEVVAALPKGTQVTITDETTGADGCIWYQVTFVDTTGESAGYMRADFVTKSSENTENENDAYVQSLLTAGFPESYCEALLGLHQLYPNWQFVAVDTGLEWAEAVAGECVTGKNLVQSVANDARKSTDTAAYDFTTNQWYGYDGAGWVCASPEFIAYCMDPRNFLTEEMIFQFETLEYADYQTKAGVKAILKNTFMSGKYKDTDGKKRSYAATFTKIGKSLAVSPYHLASRCKQEQGTKGSSPLISGTYQGYEGYYNYFNVGAYTTSTASTIVNGLITAKKNGWNSIYSAIAGGSSVVADNYIRRGQNTIYFEKFNVVYQKSLYSHQYMTNVMAAISEGSSMGKAYADKNQAFVFRIPVYKNMPAEPVAFADTGNPNNYLRALSVKDCQLTPGFSGANTSYSLVVDSNVEAIEVEAAAVASTSTIEGNGKYELSYGDNTIVVVCTAQNGSRREYTIAVARGTAGEQEDTGGTQDDKVVYGDLNGDGKISNKDFVLMQKHILGISTLDENAAKAADISGDGKITNKDLVLLQKHILGIAAIGS